MGDLRVGALPANPFSSGMSITFPPPQSNILSAGRLQRDGWTINLPERTMQKGKIKLDIVSQGVLPYVQIRTTSPSAYPSISSLSTGGEWES